jgi:hypothetical protein
LKILLHKIGGSSEIAVWYLEDVPPINLNNSRQLEEKQMLHLALKPYPKETKVLKMKDDADSEHH